MCSSPKGSGKCFKQTKRKESSPLEYEEYASMMRRASAVYDRIEQEKAERRLLMASQQSQPNAKKVIKEKKNKLQGGVLSEVKAFFLQPVF